MIETIILSRTLKNTLFCLKILLISKKLSMRDKGLLIFTNFELFIIFNFHGSRNSVVESVSSNII